MKGIGFEFNEEIGGKDIFSRIVPLEAHTASSLYSEEKAKLLRDLGDKVESKDETLQQFLLSMNLDQVPNPGDHIALPQELIECAAELSGVNDNPTKNLSETMSKLGEYYLNLYKQMLLDFCFQTCYRVQFFICKKFHLEHS